MANNTITAPKGFTAAGIACGIKKSKKQDLAILVCPDGAPAAGVFTTNKIVSPSVTICKKHVKSSKIFAVIINSGNANTCTGKQGHKDAVSICSSLARHINTDPHNILTGSTGIIGHRLPISKITAGISMAYKQISDSAKAGLDFAKAIMTTDTKPKQACVTLEISGKKVTIAGTAKGAGMIGPNMATTISVFTTDVSISKSLLQKALSEAIGTSLNRLTVDGHQSTNDTAIILASGKAENRIISKACPRFRKFAKALSDLTSDLAKQMALDAEGATRMFTVKVSGAYSQAQALKCARAIADYDLVKCAVHGADPNWGRIICAAGSCGVKLNPDKLTCKIGKYTVFKNGQPVKFDPEAVSKVIAEKQHIICLDLGVGKAADFCYGCDLSRDYVKINADYHT